MRDKALRDVREEQQELEALHRLDEECVHQQRAGNYLKAFDCMERALVLRRHFFGIESEEVIQACRALAEMCNLLAMSFLQQDNYAVTIDLLKKAEVLTQRHHPIERATTLNNLACYYRRLGKLHAAMTSLKRALELEKRLENVRNAADTQLNMCAILSQLGKHQEALESAQEALITLQEGFISDKHIADTTSDTGDTSSSRLDRISVMCIAYHNVGVEQEFLKDYAESVASYKKGIGLAEQYLGADHSITTTIRNSHLAAKRTLATKTRVRPRSASRDQKSPSKAGSRLLLSPRSGTLRMPSPLVKEKDRHSGSQIPTPRAIIADALSRAPLSALPPLEIQSPPSASKKKKKKTEPSEGKISAAQLSPTDPFFSPRFKFDSNSSEVKPKKLASITSPRSAAVTASVEMKTPPSSKGKRERRKSSVKKPPETGERDAKSPREERMKTGPTPRPSDDGAASQDANGATSSNGIAPHSSRESMMAEPSHEPAAIVSELTAESSDGVTFGDAYPYDRIELLVSASELAEKKREHSEERVIEGDPELLKDAGGNGQMALEIPAGDTTFSETNSVTIASAEVEDVDSTISALLTNVVELVAEQEANLLSDEVVIEEGISNVEQPPEGETSADDTYDGHIATFSSDGKNVELRTGNRDDLDALRIVEVDHDERTRNLYEFDVPGEATTEDTSTDDLVSKDYDMNIAASFESTTEEAYTEEPAIFIPDQATEASSVSSEDAAGTEDLRADEAQISGMTAELKPEINRTEEILHFKDVETVELDEDAHEESPEAHIEDTVLVNEEQTPPSAGVETTGAVMDSDGHDSEYPLFEAPEDGESHLLNAHGADSTLESTNTDELEGERQEKESYFPNDADEFARALFYEAQEPTNSGEVYYMDEKSYCEVQGVAHPSASHLQ
ncbi:uncharacterized protein KRP23_9885 [Phytophthora ramorum]|uniref:uncharacterized protein n=1 Tax=Phytophthora ramorum TaxID=164328 RepID=UPI0030AC0EB2|nr:hypothetical protein KRP23_9885 [Phytophthora ramorum]